MSTTTTTSEESKWQYVGNGLWENGDKSGARFDRKKNPVDTLNLATSYHGSSRHKASSATQELDDLMQSLNTFKLNPDGVEEPVNTNLDNMLGNLVEVMDKEGVKMTQKGVLVHDLP